jgi:diacylglycerol kinase
MNQWLNSIRFAFRGILLTFRTERNAQIELCISLAVVALGLWLHLSATEWGIVLLCIGSVLGAEIFNSAIERWCDHVTHAIDPAIRDIKDTSAGAVLMTSIIAAMIGMIIFLPKVLLRLGLIS